MTISGSRSKNICRPFQSAVILTENILIIFANCKTKNSISTTNKCKAPVQKGTNTKIVKKNPIKKSNINDLEVLGSQLGIDTLVSNIASLTSISWIKLSS
jgi:hypothetical protein